MHVFTPVLFNAPLGGLQSHVRAQAQALLSAGHQCTVMCKPGPFADSLRKLPIQVLETTFENLEGSGEQARRAGKYDLVHAHPFRSRIVGLEVARAQCIPFIVTFHGTYAESLPSYVEDTDLLIAVSAAIRDYLVENVNCPPEQIVVVPNGVDTNLFRPADVNWGDIRSRVPDLAEFRPRPHERRVFFVSRMDRDKRFVLDVVKQCWEDLARHLAFDIAWWVAGDGALRGELEGFAAQINQAAGRQLITFLGWQDEPTLSALYNACHLAIAPGRSALESMACGTPVIAIGSKGYVGLIDSQAALAGLYGNFGGFGQKREGYAPGSMFHDIDRVIYDDHLLSGMGRLSHAVVDAFFQQAHLDQTILQLYEFVCALTPRNAQPAAEYTLAARPALSFSTATSPDELSASWSYPAGPSRSVKVSDDGGLLVRWVLSAGEKFYVQSDSHAFARPPRQPEAWQMMPRHTYAFHVPARFVEGAPEVKMWVIEYDRTRRLRHSVVALRESRNRLIVKASGTTCCFRIALRFSGSGSLVLGPIQLFQRQTDSGCGTVSPDCLLRSRVLPDFQAYAGENLAFIIGPPRSGTTWLLNLLRSHPDVVAANVDNLRARINDTQTLETNVFNDNRPFSDAQIKYKFYLLSQSCPGKIVVEKTPIHLLYVDRIRRIFPRAALILTERDGRDVVTSLIHVGQDQSAWWKGAPATVTEAAILWKRYAEAALECISSHGPYQVRYETLLRNPRRELTRLLTALGLPIDAVDDQIDACRDGKNIPIPGVFREGKMGGWRKLLTQEDVRSFADITGDLLVRFGYETDRSGEPI